MKKLYQVIAVTLLLAGTVSAQDQPWKDKKWLALAVTTQSMSTWDAVNTSHALRQPGTYEINPAARPFTKLPAPAYIASAEVGAASVNYLSWRMKRSRRWYRHIWWLPQAAVIGGNVWGLQQTYRNR